MKQHSQHTRGQLSEKPPAPLIPTNDFVFKSLFSGPGSDYLLKSFLEENLSLPEEDLESITIMDPHLHQESTDDKLGILDLRLKTKTGKQIAIEIQVSPVPYMAKRAVQYASKMINSQLGPGSDYEQINQVIVFLVTEYSWRPEPAFHSRYRLANTTSSADILTDEIEVHTVELPKLSSDSAHWLTRNWLRFLKIRTWEELDMIAKTNPAIEKAAEKLRKMSMDPQSRLQYEHRERARRDVAGQFRFARESGLAEGRNEALRHVVQNMAKSGDSPEKIAAVTGLSLEEINRWISDQQ